MEFFDDFKTDESETELTSIEELVAELQEKLKQSRQFEKELRTALASQVEKSNQLQQQLEIERNRNTKLLEVIKDDENTTDEETTPRSEKVPLSAYNDLRSSFGTVSSVLMQYRYDELTLSLKKSIKSQKQKEKQVKILLTENIQYQTDFDEMKIKFREMMERMEIICCKYLNMQERKDEELFRLRTEMNSLIKIVDHLKYARECDFSSILENEELQENSLIKFSRKCDQLFMKNVELEREMEILKSESKEM